MWVFLALAWEKLANSATYCWLVSRDASYVLRCLQCDLMTELSLLLLTQKSSEDVAQCYPESRTWVVVFLFRRLDGVLHSSSDSPNCVCVEVVIQVWLTASRISLLAEHSVDRGAVLTWSGVSSHNDQLFVLFFFSFIFIIPGVRHILWICCFKSTSTFQRFCLTFFCQFRPLLRSSLSPWK